MNKVLVYTIFAILLGTVVMTVPLALIEHIESPLLNTTEEANDKMLESERSTFQSDDVWANQTLEEPGVASAQETNSEPPVEPAVPSEPSPESPQVYDTTSDELLAVSGLSFLGVMIVPSLLIALGLFIFLKRQMN